jgi:predicted esterase
MTRAFEMHPRDDGDDAADAFVHQFLPASDAAAPPLLLLHGTGGDEHALIPLGQDVQPGAALLSPRGNVLERGAPRFFRRIAEGVFDQEDLTKRTAELGRFIRSAGRRYEFEPARMIAMGFSNGANIAASLLLREPGLLRGAILLSPMVPFELAVLPDLAGTAVFIGAGKTDTIAPAAHAERLAETFTEAGAAVTLHWEPGGHTVTNAEIEAVRSWLTTVR